MQPSRQTCFYFLFPFRACWLTGRALRALMLQTCLQPLHSQGHHVTIASYPACMLGSDGASLSSCTSCVPFDGPAQAQGCADSTHSSADRIEHSRLGKLICTSQWLHSPTSNQWTRTLQARLQPWTAGCCCGHPFRRVAACYVPKLSCLCLTLLEISVRSYTFVCSFSKPGNWLRPAPRDYFH